jgi:hypothetical protein
MVPLHGKPPKGDRKERPALARPSCRRSASPLIRQMAAEKRLQGGQRRTKRNSQSWDLAVSARTVAKHMSPGILEDRPRVPETCSVAWPGSCLKADNPMFMVVSGRAGKTPHQIEGRSSGSLFLRSRDRWSRHSPRRCAASASTWAS